MEPSHKFFANRSCAYYPCHDFPDVNCLFCFCPLYPLDCGGDYAILDNGLKDCSRCSLPHGADGWDRVMARLKRQPAAGRTGMEGIVVECEMCGAALDKPGAIVLSPPFSTGTRTVAVDKYHVCRACWLPLLDHLRSARTPKVLRDRSP